MTETLEQQVRRVRKEILVRRVRAAQQDLAEIRVIQDRLALTDPRDPQAIRVQPVVQVMSAQLAAQVHKARRDLLEIEATPDQLAPRDLRDQLVSVKQARRVRQE
jgi:hypothetical protein